MALRARCSFKMVISRPREHFARGQFNSGRMIAPSRSLPSPLLSLLVFSVSRLCLYPGPGCHPIPLVRTRYIPRARPCDFSIAFALSFLFRRIRLSSLPLPPPDPVALAPLYHRLSRPLSIFFPHTGANGAARFLSPRIISMEIASR